VEDESFVHAGRRRRDKFGGPRDLSAATKLLFPHRLDGVATAQGIDGNFWRLLRASAKKKSRFVRRMVGAVANGCLDFDFWSQRPSPVTCAVWAVNRTRYSGSRWPDSAVCGDSQDQTETRRATEQPVQDVA